MSEVPDSDLPPEFRERLLEEIKDHLPAFLRRSASEQRDLLGDVSSLLNLQEGDLRRVIAVHACLDDRVLAFGDALDRRLRSPATSSRRPPATTQAVRGPVDWSATAAQRSRQGGDRSRFVVRPARRTFDTPENRTVAWLLERLRESARAGLRGITAKALAEDEISEWPDRIKRLADQVDRARRYQWLRDVRAEAPSAATLRRLRASGNRFYSVTVARAARVMLGLANPSRRALTEALRRRYFEPRQTWVAYEVCVALRLARAFEAASGRPRKARLLVGSGEPGPYARFGFDDGSEISLTYQRWPLGWDASQLRRLGARHDLKVGEQRPDIFIVRSGPEPDVAILELKASDKRATLVAGLKELLVYLGDRSAGWRRRPAGWLVAPASGAFADGPADGEGDLWLLSADRVAGAAVERFAPAGAG